MGDSYRMAMRSVGQNTFLIFVLNIIIFIIILSYV